MFGVTVRDHMMVAHSFRGEVFGPAQRAARRDVRGRRDVPRRGRSTTTAILVDIGRAAAALRAVVGRADLPQPRRRAGVRGHQHDHRGAGAPRRRPAGRAGPRRARSVPPPHVTALVGDAARVARRLGELRACAVNGGRPRPGAGGDPRPLPPERGQHLRPAAWARPSPTPDGRSSVVEVPGGWPWSADAGRGAAGRRPGGARRTARSSLVDGLLASRPPRAGRCRPAARLRLVLLVHMPVGAATPRRGGGAGAAAAVVTTSAWCRTWLLGAYGARPGAGPRGAPGGRRRTRRRGRTGGRTAAGPWGGRLLCVGAVTPGKGQDLLLAALARVARPALALHLRRPRHPGTRASSARLRREAARAGLAERFLLVGPRVGGALDAAYAAADVLVRGQPGGDLRDGRHRGARPRAAGDRHRRRRRAGGTGIGCRTATPAGPPRAARGHRSRWPTRSGAGSRTRGLRDDLAGGRGASVVPALAGWAEHRRRASAGVLRRGGGMSAAVPWRWLPSASWSSAPWLWRTGSGPFVDRRARRSTPDPGAGHAARGGHHRRVRVALAPRRPGPGRAASRCRPRSRPATAPSSSTPCCRAGCSVTCTAAVRPRSLGRRHRACPARRGVGAGAGQVVQVVVAAVVLLALPSPVRGCAARGARRGLVAAWPGGRAALARRLLRWSRVDTGAASGRVAGRRLARSRWPGTSPRASSPPARSGVTAPVSRCCRWPCSSCVAAGLPLNLAGWGPREGMAAWAFAAAGSARRQGVATAVAYGVDGARREPARAWSCSLASGRAPARPRPPAAAGEGPCLSARTRSSAAASRSTATSAARRPSGWCCPTRPTSTGWTRCGPECDAILVGAGDRA